GDLGGTLGAILARRRDEAGEEAIDRRVASPGEEDGEREGPLDEVLERRLARPLAEVEDVVERLEGEAEPPPEEGEPGPLGVGGPSGARALGDGEREEARRLPLRDRDGLGGRHG